MGKAKGKKLWRKTIDTKELEEAIEESTLKERQGLTVESIPDDQLFYIDEEQDAAVAAAVTRGTSLTKKRKREPKLLRCQTILSAAHQAKPVNPAASNPKGKGPAVKAAVKTLSYGKSLVKTEGNTATKLDLWENRIAPDPAERPATEKRRIQGVEVDIPGCSFNPEAEQHQDALAEAVAAEMAKTYARDHEPLPNVHFNHMPEPDELTALLGDSAYEEDDSLEDEELEATREGRPDTAEGNPAGTRLPEKKTQKDKNKAKRRKEAEEELSAKQKLKKQRRDLDNVIDFNKELEHEEVLQQAKAIRKAITKAEKALLEPPKLGKHKFQPANIQVLLSEEIDGSLRRLKGMPMLTKDRFKAIQKQGLIEPRVRIEQMTRRKRVEYQTGDRNDKAKAGHDETTKLIKSQDRARAKKKQGK